MNLASDYSFIFELPWPYWLAVIALAGLFAEALLRWREKWAVPTMLVYLTIAGWYMAEPINSPETFGTFSDAEIGSAYLSVFIFLVSLRLLATVVTSIMEPAKSQVFDVNALPAERVFWIAAVGWLILVAIGISRMNGNVFAALFPIESRNQEMMWQRAAGADAGTFGFAISIAGYLYILVLALFGMLLPLIKKPAVRLTCVACILVSWPYAFLQGSRNITLAVFIPLVISFLLFSKLRYSLKVAFGIVSLLFIEWAMRQIITFRNLGFDYAGEVVKQKHLGLNMASELTYASSFIHSGVLSLGWGYGFFTEAANVVPRFLWPDKPLIGIDFTIARGYGSVGNDIGAFATISSGLIGQGVLEFGSYFGPIVMAFFMAIWVGFLARLWSQGTVPRVCLFMVGLGLTFNMGRNLTLLVLWPMVFAYIVVVIIEKASKKRPRRTDVSARGLARTY